MTREEAIRWLEETIQDTDACWNSCSEALQRELDEQKEVFLMALSALCPVSREQVEKVWRGEWTHPHWSNDVSCADCKRCGKEAYHQLYHGVQDYYNFCPHCGAPMTDEAVQMVMERLEAQQDEFA